MPSSGTAQGPTLRFFLSSDVTLPVQFRLDALIRLRKGFCTSGIHEREGQGQEQGVAGRDLPHTAGRHPNASPAALGWSGNGYQENEEQLYVEAQVYTDGMPFGLPEISRCTTRDAAGVFLWRQWLEMPVRYCDLSSTAQLALTVWNAATWDGTRHLVGGTTVRLFSEQKSEMSRPRHEAAAERESRGLEKEKVCCQSGQGESEKDIQGKTQRESQGRTLEDPERMMSTGGHLDAEITGGRLSASSLLMQQQCMLKMGRVKLKLWERLSADGAVDSSTPGRVLRVESSEAERLEHLVGMYERGELPRVPWLDHLAFPVIGSVIEEEDGPTQVPWDEEIGQSQPDGVSFPILLLEFPTFDHSVAFQDIGGFLAAPFAALPPSNEIIIHAWDPEVLHRHIPNPAELKQMKLARMLTRDSVDKQLKPNLQERKEIAAVLKRPPTHALSKDDVQLLWRFRYSLTSDRHALTKFLRCVDWSDALEASQATELMLQWAPIDTADALELLSPSFLSDQVRAYAVAVLQRAADDELQSYLLQLVHALRYERSDNSNLAALLVSRGCCNPVLANFLHWYLRVERQDPNFAARYAHVHDHLLASLLTLGQEGQHMHDTISRQSELDLSLCRVMLELKSIRGGTQRKVERLRHILEHSEIGHSLTHLEKPLALPLDPREATVGVVPNSCSVFKSALHPLKLTFRMLYSSEETQRKQGQKRSTVESAIGEKSLRDSSESRGGAAVGPECQMDSSSSGAEGASRDAEGECESGEASEDSSAQASKAADGQRDTRDDDMTSTYLRRVIFKKGDDLRQDQLVIQLISLMDKLLKKENLDLKLTPYRVLATSSDQGYVEFIPSMPLAQVLAEHRSIVRYLHQFHPNPEALPGSPPSLSPLCLDTFLRSCAGYCVIMYILGVGDRHLDNLLLCEDGRLFHIDFGFILGRDPKPFPPPMKLCREMVDVMGGSGVGGSQSGGVGTGTGGGNSGGTAGNSSTGSTSAGKWDSADYRRFRSYCCEAFNILRSHSRLILNLFHLMAHSGFPDFAADPDNVVLKVEQKFRLDLDDAAAVQFIQSLIHESVSALFPQMVETIHRWAQYWR